MIILDKLLNKARHSLLVVSFLGIVFSLTGASFTGQSAIASYLGLKFSDANGFKWVYLIVLLYTFFRYVIYYHNDFIELMSGSMKRSINRPLLRFALRRLMMDLCNGKDCDYSYGFLDVNDKEAVGVFTLYVSDFDGYDTEFFFKVDFNISNASFNNQCTLEVSDDSDFSPNKVNIGSGIELRSMKSIFNDKTMGENTTYTYVVKRFYWIGISLVFFGMLSFIYDSFTRIDFFEYAVPLFSAIIAFIMTIEYFFFSGKTLGTLPFIFNGFI